MSLKYTVAVPTLLVFSKLYTLYKEIKRRPTIAGALIGAIFLTMAVLIYFREPTGLNFDYDPYVILNVDRNSTAREIKTAYRRLTPVMHPDVRHNVDPEVAKADWIKIQRSQEILTNDKQRENFDKYGNPNGPGLNLFDTETYPDFIMNPGKKFMAFYGILAAVLMSLPLFVLVLIPGVKAPPKWLRDGIYADLIKGEQLLADNDKSSLAVFLNAQRTWDSLVGNFPRYKKSVWGTIIPIQLYSRIVLAKLSFDQMTAQDFEDATKEFNNFKKDHRNNLKEHEVMDQIKHEIKDLKNALSSTRKPGASKLLAAVSSVKK